MRVDTGKYPDGVDPARIKRLKLLSKLATFTCILMYVSYIPEIIANFSGSPVNPIQPLVAMVNATLWTCYGWLKTYKDCQSLSLICQVFCLGWLHSLLFLYINRLSANTFMIEGVFLLYLMK